MVERDINDFQSGNSLKELIHTNLLALDALIKILIIDRQVRVRHMFIRCGEQASKGLPVILDGF